MLTWGQGVMSRLHNSCPRATKELGHFRSYLAFVAEEEVVDAGEESQLGAGEVSQAAQIG